HAPRLGASATPGLSNFNGGQRWLQRMSEGVYHADLNACNNFRTELNNVQVPALVITGDRDKMAPAKRGRDVADNLPQAQVVNLPGCGHAMLTEQPNAVLDALAAFVAR
ncbi:MAG: alpha/beta fold hydrolase, partial [Pseudomonadota bacterium]